MIRAHRVRALPADEVTKLDAIPITTPARTLLDVASTAGYGELRRALARALAEGIVEQAAIRELLVRYPRRWGARKLGALLDAVEQVLTRLEAEDLFLELIRKAGLPMPEVNVVVFGYEVDFYWRAHGLVVEVDGFAFHSSAERFERDRLRDGVLASKGLRVVRVTWRQMRREPEAMLVRLAQVLAGGGAHR